MTEIELRERDVNKFTALAGADRLVQYLPWFALMSGQHRHAEPEAGDVACLDPRAVTEDGEFVRVGGCRDRRALSHAASPARQPCGAAYAGTQAHSAGESIVTSDSSVTASAATSGAGTTVVGIVPALPVVFRSNSARQFMFSAGGAGVEATNRAPTGPLLYSGRPETRSAGARAMGNLATVFWLLGHHGPAAEHYQQALALYRRAGDRTGEANSLTNLGKVELPGDLAPWLMKHTSPHA